VFRNFLTFSYTENFEKKCYVDNEFYISKITEMRKINFEQVQSKENNNYIKIFPYRKGTSFYLEIPENESIEIKNISNTNNSYM
jgi:hypothetical protein